MPFKFENILNYRKLIENKLYVEFSSVQKEYLKVNMTINNIKNKIESYKSNYPNSTAAVSSINDFMALESGYNALLSALNRTLKEKDSIEKELEKRRLALLKSKIEFEKINKLKEKYLVTDKLNSIKKEEVLLDDLTSNQYNSERS